jgi:acyl carrier protein
MELDTFIKNFEEAVEDVEVGTLTAQTRFKDLKSWDSLAILIVTDTIDMEYDVVLRKSDFESSDTLVELFELVQIRLKK